MQQLFREGKLSVIDVIVGDDIKYDLSSISLTDAMYFFQGYMVEAMSWLRANNYHWIDDIFNAFINRR